MLDNNMQKQLGEYLTALKNPVEIIVFADDSEKSLELKKLVEQIAKLSSLVTTMESSDSQNERTPSMLIRSVKRNTEIRFAGIPLGHEFTSLVLALLHSGDHPIKIEPELIEQVRNLSGEYNFETYISLSCRTCPDVVQALNMMAAINPNIHTTMIDGAVYPEEVKERNILAVPTTYLNGELFSQGRIGLQDIINKLDSNSIKRIAESLNNKPAFDLLVVGGGPAGAAAAIYAARKGIRTGIVADNFGGQVLDTMGIENFISVKSTEGPKMVAGLEEHVRQYDVDIMTGQRAKQISQTPNHNGYFEITLENNAQLKSRTIIVATGARWREIGAPGEKEYSGRGVAYCPHCDGPLFKGKKVAVIGGGNSGIEAAIDLAGITEHVTVLEFDSKLRADEVLQNKARSTKNITIITNAATTEVSGDGQQVTGLSYQDRNTEEIKQLTVDGVFVQIGLMPNSEFLKQTIELSDRNEIIVDAQGQTSTPGIYAAGDVTNSVYKQIIIAMGSGATAALGAFDHLIRTSTVEDVAA